MASRQRKVARSLAQKFYLLLVVPLILISGLVTWITYRGLDSNAAELATALRVQGKSNSVLPLLLTQDDTSKSLLIDPSKLALFSDKKITAYDEHKKLLTELSSEATDPAMQALISELAALDETKLRPLDTQILELLFEDVDKARALYFTDYEPHRLEYEKKIRELARLGAEHAEEARIDMTKKNSRSLLLIALALVLGIAVIATTITILSRQIERSNDNTKSLLAVLGEGLFFFGRDGVIAPERSQALGKIIPGADHVDTLQQFVGKYSATSEDNVKTCLKLLWNVDGDDFLSDFDSTITFLPKSLVIDGSRIVELEYRPLYGRDKQLEKVVVVAADVTEKRKNEREAVVQAERVRKISRVAAGLDSYLSFFDEAIGLFRRADGLVGGKAKGASDLAQLRRDLHTLKGSIGTFEFTSLAHEIHEIETLLDEEGPSSARLSAHWDRIKDQWKFETSDIETVLRLKESQGKVTLTKSKFDTLIAHAQATSDDKLAGLLKASLRVTVKDAFAKYKAYLEKLTDRQNEKQIRLAYVADSDEISHAEMQGLDPAFVHIVRNCLDHGIEASDVRRKAHKAAAGTIQIACYRKSDGWLHFVIKDDGQGVDGDKLAQKAVLGGLWTAEKAAAASYQEKIELVFIPNLSSKDEVSEISGRGVGMDAVKTLVEELGGKITIFSQPGQGTQFELDVPPIPASIPVAYASKAHLASIR